MTRRSHRVLPTLVLLAASWSMTRADPERLQRHVGDWSVAPHGAIALDAIAAALGELGATPLPGLDDFRLTDGQKPWGVAGFLPPTGDGDPSAVEAVVLGSHDVAGAAVAFEAGARMKSGDRKRGIVLIVWPVGHGGPDAASRFLESGAIAVEGIAAYIHLGDIGGMSDNILHLAGTGSSSIWPRLVERANVVVGFDVRTTPVPHPGTVAAVFSQAEVPAIGLSATASSHPPVSDKDRGLDFEDLDRIAHLGALFMKRLDHRAERPDFVAVADEPQERPTPQRAFTGTIPDYIGGGDGLRLSGVVPGGPAEAVGLREGDVIVEFGGHAITDINDYAAALESAEVGVPLEVVIVRGDERLRFTLTPVARK